VSYNGRNPEFTKVDGQFYDDVRFFAHTLGYLFTVIWVLGGALFIAIISIIELPKHFSQPKAMGINHLWRAWRRVFFSDRTRLYRPEWPKKD
jgi:hypothetical protein